MLGIFVQKTTRFFPVNLYGLHNIIKEEKSTRTDTTKNMIKTTILSNDELNTKNEPNRPLTSPADGFIFWCSPRIIRTQTVA